MMKSDHEPVARTRLSLRIGGWLSADAAGWGVAGLVAVVALLCAAAFAKVVMA